MPRITGVEPAQAHGRPKTLLDAVQQQMGTVPNLFKALAHAPAALDGYLQLSGALAKGVLPRGLREQIALAVAGANGCDYCASAHTFLGKAAGVDEAELARNLDGRSDDSKTRVALDFAKAVVETRGRVSDAQLAQAREAGFSEGEIVEVVAHVAMNVFTNYFNHVAGTPVDFPLVEAGASATSV